MNPETKVSLAKKIVKDLSKQGTTVQELNDVCDMVKKIASNSMVELMCIDRCKNWFNQS